MHLPFSALFPDADQDPWLKRARLKKNNTWGLAAGDYLIFDLYPAHPQPDSDLYFTVENVKTEEIVLTARCEIGEGFLKLLISTRHLQGVEAPAVRNWLEEILQKPALREALNERYLMYSFAMVEGMMKMAETDPEFKQDLAAFLDVAPPEIQWLMQQKLGKEAPAVPGKIVDFKPSQKSKKASKSQAKKPEKNAKSAQGGIQIKVSLLDTPLPILRELEIPASLNLSQLHEVLQVAMGWENYHLWEFMDTEDNHYLPVDPDSWGMDEGLIDPESVTVAELLTSTNDRLLYTYDMGDSWVHLIEVKNILPETRGLQLLSALNACPPEDCGGIWGYQNILNVLGKKRKSREDKELLEWLGDDFDPAALDLAGIKRDLSKIGF